MELGAGQTLSHYRLLKKIEQGGMGEVYLAEDTTLNRRVALKVLAARFEREAQAVAALNHPNIVTIHSVERDQGIHFFTMELIEGRTLSALIPASGLPAPRLFEYAIPLADAMGAAHAEGITYRGLELDNVMITPAARLKVLYMPSEQAEGKPADARSDVFSLGIMLYEMTTGRRPVASDTAIPLTSSILEDDPPALNELERTALRHLARIIDRCLAKDPDRRYPTAKEVRKELEVLKREVYHWPERTRR